MRLILAIAVALLAAACAAPPTGSVASGTVPSQVPPEVYSINTADHALTDARKSFVFGR